MARQLRIEYEGAIYHVMSRGDRREAIFLNDEDRQLFLKTLEETCVKAGWLIHVTGLGKLDHVRVSLWGVGYGCSGLVL